jgi:uncharacterized protein YdeI (YjbR/CyaY-like superfamily)
VNEKLREIRSSISYLEDLNTDQHPDLNKISVGTYLDHVQYLYAKVLDLVDADNKLKETKEDIDDILYSFHVKCGTLEEINENGHTEGHYLIEQISAEIEKYFNKL